MTYPQSFSETHASDQDSNLKHIVVMGTSGTGKTTIAQLLANTLGWEFTEGDDFHSSENIAKMENGTQLDDNDRWPWLTSISDWITEQDRKGKASVITCSALKRVYRDLISAADDVYFAHLNGTQNVIAQRMAGRRGHFMPTALLDSQFKTLEPLQDGEKGKVYDSSLSPEEIVERIITDLGV